MFYNALYQYNRRKRLELTLGLCFAMYCTNITVGKD